MRSILMHLPKTFLFKHVISGTKNEIYVFVPFSCGSHLWVCGVLVKKLVGVEGYLGYNVVQELGSVDPISEAFV